MNPSLNDAGAGLAAVGRPLSREERLARVVRWLLAGKSWSDYIEPGRRLETEAREALND